MNYYESVVIDYLRADRALLLTRNAASSLMPATILIQAGLIGIATLLRARFENKRYSFVSFHIASDSMTLPND